MKNCALVVGLGVSGLAACKLLESQGYGVLGFDDRRTEVGRRIFACEEIPWENVDFLLLSPGISLAHPVCLEAQKRGLKIVGEVEFALRQIQQKAIAITGTNGKTTVTLLATHILNQAGVKARALGNVGEPITSYLLQADPDEVLVIELSSYQLETLHSKAFLRGIILNITPDHLDRYQTMERYAEAKCHLQECIQGEGLFCVQEAVALEYSHLLKQPYATFGESQIHALLREIPALAEIAKAKHDLENILAAWILLEPFSLSEIQFLEGVRTFKKPEHRIEFIGEKEGISFYDDSKGTNLDAVIQAVATMPGPVILIAGGVDKGASYAPWKNAFLGKVKKLCLIGEAASKIHQELSADFAVECLSSLEEAVKIAVESASLGDCVLLSPGCSSFDMFRDYAHRGEVFQKCVADYRRGEV